MLRWTWGTWPDPLVDFGQQLYIPWQLSEGKVLYRDIAFYNGPLSQHWNSLIFRLFGVGLRSLVIANIALLAGFTALLYYSLRQIAGRAASTAGGLVFLLMFACAQFVGIGNYNYVCPYSHEMTHGLMLSFAALACAWAWPRRGLPAAAAAGFLLGLAFLTKAEVLLGGAAAVIVFLGLSLFLAGTALRRALSLAGTFLSAAIVPPAVAFLTLGLQMDPATAITGTFGSWAAAANPQLANLAFFRQGMGTDDVAGNLGRMFIWGGWLLVMIGLPVLIGFFQKKNSYKVGTAIIVSLAAVSVLWASKDKIKWYLAARPLPLIMLAAVAVIGSLVIIHRKDVECAPRLMRQLSLVILGMVMLAKMVLNARIEHYGFVLAMPATIITVVIVLDWLPEAVRRSGGNGLVVLLTMVAVLAVWSFAHLRVQGRFLEMKTTIVGQGVDAFRSTGIGETVNAAVKDISARCRPGCTLAVLPEGVMLNYLCRRVNPAQYTNFMPPEMIVFGEEEILGSFRAHPPEVIALVHKDTSEFGARFFGRDYGRSIMDWIMNDYKPARCIGAVPLTGPDFGIMMLEHKNR